MVEKTEIYAMFSADDRMPLGDIWRITAKKTDFYLDALWSGDLFHLSAHGPNDAHSSHRFHLKHDRRAAAALVGQGHFVAVGAFPRGGLPLAGEQLGDRTCSSAYARRVAPALPNR